MTATMDYRQVQTKLHEFQDQTFTEEERCELAIDLASVMLQAAEKVQSKEEQRLQHMLAGMIDDPMGKVFVTRISDQCFRSGSSKRVANQINYLIQKYGTPSYLSFLHRVGLKGVQYLSSLIPWITVPLVKKILRKEMSRVILPGEKELLIKHIHKRIKGELRVNLNHLGEAILGEEEAQNRLDLYISELKRPEVEYISVKVSSIFSQLNLLAWEKTLDELKTRLRILYRTAQQERFTQPDGSQIPKFVNLDMEAYRDLHLTLDLFQQVLEEPEFLSHSAGIVLQAYLPDSYLLQKKLTIWAMQRCHEGGAPIKIRIVKGANLCMEQVDASLHGWSQAPYSTKKEVDANYKRMLLFGTTLEHIQAAHIGVASHNLFDIAYALILTSERKIAPYICFEMLEGMADHIRKIVQQLSQGLLLYCPSAKKEEFQNAIAYLIRRLDENTTEDNFLRSLFELKVGSKDWKRQKNLFKSSCQAIHLLSSSPNRKQSRINETFEFKPELTPFQNEPDTDWTLPHNRKWENSLLKEWENKVPLKLSLCIGGKLIQESSNRGQGRDPSRPDKTPYTFPMADEALIEQSLATAEKAQEKWKRTPLSERIALLGKVAYLLKKKRKDLLGAMVLDGGKVLSEADSEYSEAIDFAEYYRHSMKDWSAIDGIDWEPKGTVLITPPWNFPASIPIGGCCAALITGNTVIFKPAQEAALVGWMLAEIMWEAGIPKDVLQFVLCEDKTEGSQLIRDPRINTVVLTGATDTAQLFLNMRSDLDLIAETGGKNSMIISALSDRDQVIDDLAHSAFGHAGQKCSAASLAICESEVYYDPYFRKQLVDAVASKKIGSAWDPETLIPPLIQLPQSPLKEVLLQLDEGEEWLLQPQQDPTNPQLWSPGIKIGVRPGSPSHLNEFFGPVLSLMHAKDLNDAIKLANQVPYGLTAGLHSLDDREKEQWQQEILSGNCYINRTITGAIVQRQPFGGIKASCFGRGAKAGGPNYLTQLMRPKEHHIVHHTIPLPPLLEEFKALVHNKLTKEELNFLQTSMQSDLYWIKNHFSSEHDPSLIIGEDNLFSYRPKLNMQLRLQKGDSLQDIYRVIAALIACKTPCKLSLPHFFKEDLSILTPLLSTKQFQVVYEEESQLIVSFNSSSISFLRLLKTPSDDLLVSARKKGINILSDPPLSNGRLELLHYLRELSISHAYHRYGNLGSREKEKRYLPQP